MNAGKAGTVLFIDDERRVLTSMRAMFRRDYDVLLANSGAEALSILHDQHVDVIVSDQRMPGMTGVEVLRQVKALAPGAMRILLTGYADLKAIEASINEGEVFRYLTKPCPSDELKAAIGLAAEVARQVAPVVARDAAPEDARRAATTHASAATRNPPSAAQGIDHPIQDHLVHQGEPVEDEFIELLPVLPMAKPAAPTAAPVDLSRPRHPARPEAVAVPLSDTAPAAGRPVPMPLTRPRTDKRRSAGSSMEIRDVDLLALTSDREMIGVLEHALDGSHRLHVAEDLEGAIAVLESNPIGVLITDMAVSEDEIGELTTALKQHVPELITIVASDRSDAQVLIDLINYGQIFRFLLKPLHAGQCRLSMESAVGRHRELAADPTLVNRHSVAPRSTPTDGVMQLVMHRVRRLRERFFTANGVA